MKYKLIIFGCQMNYADAERVETVMRKIGYKKTDKEEQADVILIVACSVRQAAMDRIFGLQKRWLKNKLKRNFITILTGCVLPLDRKKLADFFDIIFNIKDLSRLPKLLNKKKKYAAIDYMKIQPSVNSKFQAHVPIANGCNNFCSYCVVPYVRGREVYRPAKDVIFECRKLIKKGYKEIILLGQNVNSYKSGRYDFPKLLKTINDMTGDYWLSFISSHPKDLSSELIKAMAERKHITPYLHLPIQSGDNKILKAMNRRYTVNHYKRLIRQARKAIPEIAVSTDVIVGFPGETNQQFNNTVKLFNELEFDMAYLAKYSVRPGTAAAKLRDNVLKTEKEKHWQVLNELLKKSALENNRKYLNKKVRVLVMGQKKNFLYGKTNTFKTVKLNLTNKKLIGKFVQVKIIKITPWGLLGELYDKKKDKSAQRL